MKAFRILAAALAVYVGSQQQESKLPPPFGVASNGAIALARAGDLYIVDPRSGHETLVLAGTEEDDWIGFTPDGTRGVFLRWGPENGGMTAARIGVVDRIVRHVRVKIERLWVVGLWQE